MNPHHPVLRLAIWLNKRYLWLKLSKGAQRLYAALWGFGGLLTCFALPHVHALFLQAFLAVLVGACAVGCSAALTELAVRSRAFGAALQQIDRTIHGVRVVAPHVPPRETDPES